MGTLDTDSNSVLHNRIRINRRRTNGWGGGHIANAKLNVVFLFTSSRIGAINLRTYLDIGGFFWGQRIRDDFVVKRELTSPVKYVSAPRVRYCFYRLTKTRRAFAVRNDRHANRSARDLSRVVRGTC